MTSEPATCPGCKKEIGRFITIDGLVFFGDNNLLIPAIGAICLNCGRGFYWSVKDQVIDRIIKDAIKGIQAS